jgi:hypothetical protein
LGAGPFNVSAPAPKGLRPGSYQLLGNQLTPDALGLQIAPAMLDVVAPTQGIVDRVVAVNARGRVVRAVRPLGTRRLAARFHFVVAPRTGTTVETLWFVPGRRKGIIDPAPKRKAKGVLVSSIGSKGAPLPQGLYVCQLRVAGRVIARARMRVG